MMFFHLLLFCLISLSVDARSDYTTYIQPYTYTSWGSWGSVDWCPYGTYAYGFSLKVEGAQGIIVDDTALNGIKLHCRSYCGSHGHSVTSRVQDWGSWRSSKFCPGNYFLKGASVKSEAWQGNSDDTAANNYNFLCQSFTNLHFYHHLHGNGMYWGWWTSRRDCPAGSYICGIRTQVEGKQGSGDDTALNDARFYCCKLKRKTCRG